MSYKERLSPLKDALVSIAGNNCYHYFRTGIKPPYIIWAEASSEVSNADDRAAWVGITGTIDLFSKKEFDPWADEIETALTNCATVTGWNLQSAQYEEETGLIHHEWSFEV